MPKLDPRYNFYLYSICYFARKLQNKKWFIVQLHMSGETVNRSPFFMKTSREQIIQR